MICRLYLLANCVIMLCSIERNQCQKIMKNAQFNVRLDPKRNYFRLQVAGIGRFTKALKNNWRFLLQWTVNGFTVWVMKTISEYLKAAQERYEQMNPYYQGDHREMAARAVVPKAVRRSHPSIIRDILAEWPAPDVTPRTPDEEAALIAEQQAADAAAAELEARRSEIVRQAEAWENGYSITTARKTVQDTYSTYIYDVSRSINHNGNLLATMDMQAVVKRWVWTRGN